MKKVAYSIRLSGRLGAQAKSAFAGLEIDDSEPGVTVLRSELDQSALFGVLQQVHSLSICLLEVHRSA